MTDWGTTMAQQAGAAWHDRGLFMGMHWAVWVIAIGTLVVLVWALAKVAGDRAATERRRKVEEVAEAELRARFARGELDEDQFTESLRVLRNASLDR